MTPQEIARLTTYVLAAALGVFMTVWGIIHEDAATVTAGIGLIGTGSLAGANTGTRSKGDHAAE